MSGERDERPEASRDRKDAHLEITARGAAAFETTTTLLEEVALIHQALPELSLDAIDLRTKLLGKALKAPLLIGAMTGGTPTARDHNLELAAIAEETGIGFCLGSARPMLEDPALASTYAVRDRAPTALLLANLGAMQAKAHDPEAIAHMVASLQADALMIHLNPAQELMQPSGDRDFRGALEAIARLVEALPVPVVVKETGCGLSRQAGEALVQAGVRCVEVAGAGGTSWPRVEAARAPERAGLLPALGEWGIPTAASLLLLQDLPLIRIAGGGLRDARDLASALALGAHACTLAQPVLAHLRSPEGPVAARTFIEQLIEGLRALCLLTGSPTPKALAQAPRVLGARLLAYRAAARPGGLTP